MKILLVSLSVLCVTLWSCSKPAVQILSPTLLDGAADGSVCQMACQKRFLNGCTGDESRCEEVCANDEELGAASQLDPGCIVAAKTLPELQACDPSCQGPQSAATAASITTTVGIARPTCHADGGLPDPKCTPGDVETQDLAIICGQSTKERRNVTTAEKRAGFAQYGLEYPQPHGDFEYDHLVAIELGGSNDPSNLWPQPAEPHPGWREKDQVENLLHRRVCSGAMSIADAQHQIATDWIAVWKAPPGP